MTTYYVSTTGNNSNSGLSLGSAWATLQKAADTMVAGDTCLVADGTYTITSGDAINTSSGGGSSGSPITFRAINRGGAVFSGNNQAADHFFVFYTGSSGYYVVDGFEVYDFQYSGVVRVPHVTVQNCEFHDLGRICSSSDTGLGDLYADSSADYLTVDSCLFYNIGRFAAGENGCSPSNEYYKNHDHAIYLGGCDNVTITNCVFYNCNRGWPLHLYPSAMSNLLVANCTFHGANPWRDGHIEIACNLTNCKFVNNIFSAPTSYVADYYTGTLSGVTFSYNLTDRASFFSSTPSGVTLSNNLTSTSPGFTNSGAADFTLLSTSAARDAGTATDAPSTDYTGASRPYGASYDIGAYEYSSGGLSGALSKTLAPATLSSDSVLGRYGGATASLAALSLASAGELSGSGTPSGFLQATLADVSASSDAQLGRIASSSITLAALTANAIGGAGAPAPGNFYFAWVEPAETTFLPSHRREDEKVIAFDLEHAEGQFALLGVTVKRLDSGGYLNASRRQWAWLAYNDGSTITPLFFGRIVGFPRDIDGESVKLDFVARPREWHKLKSSYAETLKVAPFWDPIFVSPDKRANPDAVLEARPERWHIDRVTHEVTTSNIITGEDGTIAFGGDDVVYDSVKFSYGQIAGRRVTVQAEVNWTQRATGSLNLTLPILIANLQAGGDGGLLLTSFTGEGLAKDWPRAGREIGGGWTFGPSYALDKTGLAINDLLEVSAQDGQKAGYPVWGFVPFVTVNYDANRPRYERIVMSVNANVQDLATEPEDEETIVISVSSQDVGQPIDALVTPPNWAATTAYAQNDYVRSNGAIYRCIKEGISGSTAPDGTSATIVDGSCIWAWASFESTIDMQLFAQPWRPSTVYAVGDIVQNGGLIYECVVGGLSAASGGPVGFQAAQWEPDSYYFAADLVQNGGLFYYCMFPGVSGSRGPIPFTISWDGSVQWAWIAAPEGGGYINDGAAKWIWRKDGLPIGDLGRRQYFSTDRGIRSVEYLICLARAALLVRSRAVTVSFTVPFESGLALSLRKNATITDDRLPGGTATGKITYYRMSVDANAGIWSCEVSIGCAVGRGGTLPTDTSVGTYVEDGYVERGYQQMQYGYNLPDGLTDISYQDFEATPIYDDGIDFTSFHEYDAIQQLAVVNSNATQAGIIIASGSIFEAQDLLREYPTMVDLYLKPVQGGTFVTDYVVVCSDLIVPKKIDLEAA